MEQTVEKKVETAVAQPPKEAPAVASEVDYEAELARKDAEIAKVQQEKENYRKGMLKAKGKLPEDSDEPETQEEMVRRITREEMLFTKEAQLQAEKDNTLKDVLKQNKELKVALKNRGQITSNTASGSNEDKPEVKTDSYFSEDQVADLKAKGWSDAKIEAAKKNMQKKDQFSAPS